MTTPQLKDPHTCFKLGCYKAIKTWELTVGPYGSGAPQGLCRDHAERPNRCGTIERPTLIDPRKVT